jgi:hypothetical protein
MTLDELEEQYCDYVVVSPDGRFRRRLHNLIPVRAEDGDGIYFNWTNGVWLLRPDADNNCWQKQDFDAPVGEGWVLVGTFEKAAQQSAPLS